MRDPLLLLLLLVPVVRAAPKVGEHSPETPTATNLEPDPDPPLQELPLLLQAVRSAGRTVRDAEAMSREQALLYLFVLHDHDRSGRLDGLELLQLLGTVLALRDGARPDPDTVAALVDRALERQDLSRDGLLDPHELLLSTPRDQGPLGQPLPEQLGELMVGAGDTESPGGAVGVNSAPGHGANPQAETSDGEALEVQKVPEAGGPEAEALEAGVETPEVENPEGEPAPVLGDSGEE